MYIFNKYNGRGLWLAALLLTSLITGCNSSDSRTPVTAAKPSVTDTSRVNTAISDNKQVSNAVLDIGTAYANVEGRRRPLPPTHLTVK